jgi:hypothetical protein
MKMRLCSQKVVHETTNAGTIELLTASLTPVTNEDTAITDEDTSVIIPVLDNDPDTYYNSSGDYFGTLDPTTVAVVSSPLHGITEALPRLTPTEP